MLQQAVLAMNLREQLSLCSDEEDSDEEEGEACGGKSEDVYDDGECIKFYFYRCCLFSLPLSHIFTRLNGSDA
jgi:hypothetical protein